MQNIQTFFAELLNETTTTSQTTSDSSSLIISPTTRRSNVVLTYFLCQGCFPGGSSTPEPEHGWRNDSEPTLCVCLGFVQDLLLPSQKLFSILTGKVSQILLHFENLRCLEENTEINGHRKITERWRLFRNKNYKMTRDNYSKKNKTKLLCFFFATISHYFKQTMKKKNPLCYIKSAGMDRLEETTLSQIFFPFFSLG